MGTPNFCIIIFGLIYLGVLSAGQCTTEGADCAFGGVTAAGKCFDGQCLKKCTPSSTTLCCDSDRQVLFASGTVCRDAKSICDLVERCTGTSATCPTDAFVPSSTKLQCGDAPNSCYKAPLCSGTALCPAPTALAKGTICRPIATGSTCDVAETCPGSGAPCPDDKFKASGTSCRPLASSLAVCDVPEFCTGDSASCPPDVLKPDSVVCRASAGLCDPAEYCTGTTTTCPTNKFEPNTKICNPAKGLCDKDEMCSGTTAACPTDSKKASGTVCRASAGPCDIAEVCNGSSVDCPSANKLQPNTVACSGASCKEQIFCSGTSDQCPSSLCGVQFTSVVRDAFAITTGGTRIDSTGCSTAPTTPCTYTITTLPFKITVGCLTLTSLQVTSNGIVKSVACTSGATSEFQIYAFTNAWLTKPTGMGIFTKTLNATPNRVFSIVWKVSDSTGAQAQFEVQFSEGKSVYKVILGSSTYTPQQAQPYPNTALLLEKGATVITPSQNILTNQQALYGGPELNTCCSLPTFVGTTQKRAVEDVEQSPTPTPTPIGLLDGINLDSLPENSALKKKVASLSAAGKAKASAALSKTPSNDAPYLHVSDEGQLGYIDAKPDLTKVLKSHVTVKKRGVEATGIPALHSRPGAPNTLFINFGGFTVSNSAWFDGDVVVQPMNLEGASDDTTDYEAAVIQDTWERVSEDYSPWNIDVTTERPTSFNARVGHIIVAEAVDPLPAWQNAGGIAYVGVFGDASSAAYQIGFCYSDNVGGDGKGIAECVAHEFGHNLGLHHDGTSTLGYFSGLGSSSTGWAPIMGAGYYKPVTQFSKGEYPDANNQEDDLAIIGKKLPFVTYDTTVTTAPGTACTQYFQAKGLINSASNTNTWALSINTKSSVQISINATEAPGFDLLASVQLIDSANAVVASSTFTQTTTTLSVPSVIVGAYSVVVKGIGNAQVPYTNYASIGSYALGACVLDISNTCACFG